MRGVRSEAVVVAAGMALGVTAIAVRTAGGLGTVVAVAGRDVVAIPPASVGTESAGGVAVRLPPQPLRLTAQATAIA